MSSTVITNNIFEMLHLLFKAKSARDNDKFTIYKLAKALDMPHSMLVKLMHHDINKRVQNPRIDTLSKIVNYFNQDGFKIKIDDLINGTIGDIIDTSSSEISRAIKACIFVSANTPHNPIFEKEAKKLAKTLAENNIDIVYGGASVGIMGSIANTAIKYNGRVIGVIPKDILGNEIAHRGLTQLHFTETMRERKLLMAELSDIFIVLPGGFGTLEELFEAINSIKIGLYKKNIYILNTNGFYTEMMGFLENSLNDGFIKKSQLNIVRCVDSIHELMENIFCERIKS